MAKKINCKHGLDRKQEIEARRLRVKLEVGDESVLAKYHLLWENWFKAPSMSFETYIQQNNIVYFSAYVRACDSIGGHVIFNRIATYHD